MAEQEITFKHGDDSTGDSGERGDATGADEGFESIKPIDNGERAEESVYNRALENLRRRSEQLRDAGEQQLYFQDSDMRWAITGGNADGLSPGPELYPGIENWNSGTGVFEVTEPMVVQPLNTPAIDKQETVTYPFDDTVSTGAMTFTPISSKRDYNGANRIQIVWNEAADLTGAVEDGLCDVVVSGDPVHILTITILDSGLTRIADLDSALATISSSLTTMGLGYADTGTPGTHMTLAEVQATEYTVDYTMIKNFDREVHYIPESSFSDFFASKSLSDGDTLSVWFTDYTNEEGPPPTGRRQRIPANSNTTIYAAELFITSEHPERIPLAIPLCKRIGDDLFWLDGTVVLATQNGEPVLMGEHGNTLNRLQTVLTNLAKQTVSSGATLVGVSTLTDSPSSISAGTLQTTLASMLVLVNARSRIVDAETITGAWDFTGGLTSTGTSTGFGLTATGSTGGSGGLKGTGTVDSQGVYGIGGPTAGDGVHGEGTGGGRGVFGEGNGVGSGVVGQGGLTDGAGVEGYGVGIGPGVYAEAAGDGGAGVIGKGYGDGQGGLFYAGATGANIRLMPRTGAPGTFLDGSVWYDDSGTHDGLYAQISGTARSLVPTWAFIELESGTAQLRNHYNVLSAAVVTGAYDLVRITFDNAFFDTYYAVVANVQLTAVAASGVGLTAEVQARSASVVDVVFRNGAGERLTDLVTLDYSLSIAIHGNNADI